MDTAFQNLMRPSVTQLQPSLIRRVANAAMGREDVIPLRGGQIGT